MRPARRVPAVVCPPPRVVARLAVAVMAAVRGVVVGGATARACGVCGCACGGAGVCAARPAACGVLCDGRRQWLWRRVRGAREGAAGMAARGVGPSK